MDADAGDVPDLAAIDPAVADVREVEVPRGRGVAGWLVPRWRRVPVLGPRRPMVVRIGFRPA